VRHLFGGDIAAWTIDLGDNATGQSGQDGYLAVITPSAEITFYDAATAGNQYTDLLTADGTPITSVTSDTNGELPQFQGPDTDPETWQMWADGSGGAGPRRLMVATDIGTTLNAQSDAIADLQAQMDAVQALLAITPLIVRETGGAWPTRPDIIGDRTAIWVGDDTPSVGGGYMRDDDTVHDLYVDTQP
jgi:hypothetical protein